MAVIILALIIATICIQIPNLLGVAAASGDTLTWMKAAKISLVTLPITFVATICYTIFYGRGHLFMSYPMLSVMAKVAAIAVALIIQVWWLNNRQTNMIEMVGVTIAIAGTTIAILNQDIQKLLSLS